MASFFLQDAVCFGPKEWPAMQRMPATVSLDALRQDDPSAWADFFSQYDGAIRAVVAWPKWRFEPEVQKDVAQTVRVEVVKSIANVQSAAGIEGFVKRICVYRCIDEVRRQIRERRVMVPLTMPDHAAEPSDAQSQASADFDPVRAIAMAEEAEELRRAMAQLEPPCHTVIRQFYLDGLSYAQIAQSEQVSVNTVGSRLSRCLEKLRTFYGRNRAACSTIGAEGATDGK
jgi:RNA polymerase sigma factor (sigma-70 family)